MEAESRGRSSPGIQIRATVLIVSFLVAVASGTVIGLLAGGSLSANTIAAITADRAADRQRIVDASTNLLTEVLEKLANVSHHKRVEKGIAIFDAARDVFSGAANLHSIVEQSGRLCGSTANGTFHDPQMPFNVTENYTAACMKYPMLAKDVDPFRSGTVSITDSMAAVADVVTALMKLDNAIVADP